MANKPKKRRPRTLTTAKANADHRENRSEYWRGRALKSEAQLANAHATLAGLRVALLGVLHYGTEPTF